jgi:hypothetical protein
LPVEEVGFELNNEDDGEFFKYELILPPTPQIKVLNSKEKTLKEEGLFPRALVNIK